MATFAILTGKKLASAIAGFGKVAATFTEKTHQLAYSALNHVEQHHDACYVQSLYEATPVNYRSAIVNWATNFGKVTFDATTLTFSYAKGKKSDMEGAMDVSPADFKKESSKKAGKVVSLADRTESVFTKVLKDPKARKADKAFAKVMLAHIAAYKGESATPTGENVVQLKPARKAPAKAKAEKVAA